MEPFGALFVAAFGLVALSGSAHYIRTATAAGELDRNSAIGLRTRVTTSSDAAWRSGHEAAAPWLLACAWTGYLIGAATAAGGAAALATGSVHPALLVLPAAGFVAVVVLLVRATAVANAYGRRASGG